MKLRTDYTCPLEIVHDIIKGKWKTIILYKLKNGSKSLSELQRQIDGISQKMLLEQLKELIQFGLVQKTKFAGYPLHVEYSLTADRGMYMIEALKIMQKIGVEYMLEYNMDEELIRKGVLTKEEIECMRSGKINGETCDEE